MLNPGPTPKIGDMRFYPHNWLRVNVLLPDRSHSFVFIDPTIAQFSEDIGEDIAVWHESMPGFEEAMEKYMPHGDLGAGVSVASQLFKDVYEKSV